MKFVLITVTSSFLGFSCLLMPFVASKLGILASNILIICSAVLSLYNALLIQRANFRYHFTTITELVSALISPNLAFLTNCFLLLIQGFIISIYVYLGAEMVNSIESQFKWEQSYNWSYLYKSVILIVGLTFSFIGHKIQGKFNFVSLFVYSFIIVGLIIILNKYHVLVNRNEISYF